MRTNLLGYTGFLAISLAIAYWASLPVKDGDTDKVTLWDQKPTAIDSIEYNTPDLKTSITRKSDKQLIVKVDKPAKDNQSAEVEIFVAGEDIGDLMASFNPFQALRSIPNLQEEDKVEFGLKDAKDQLVVTTKDKKIELLIGKKSYGSRNHFVMIVGDESKAYLIDGKPIQTIASAKSRLYERRLYSINFDDVKKASISNGAKQKVMAHTKRDEQGNLKWTEATENAPVKPSFDSWMDKISKLRVLNFADESQVSKLETEKEFLVISFMNDSNQLEQLTFKKIPEIKAAPSETKDKKPSAPDEKWSYWVKSDFLGTYAKVAASRVEPIEKDIPNILE